MAVEVCEYPGSSETGGYFWHRLRGETCAACSARFAAYNRAQRKARGWKNDSRPVFTLMCRFCEASFSTPYRAQRHCSQRCAARANAGWSRSTDLVVYVEPPKPRRTFTPEHSSSGRTFVAGECRRCGDQFVIVDQLTSRYCSARCLNADARDRRRARKREAFVEEVWRSRIFERDGWRCQICRRKVDRRKSVPHPKAPTLDHIIPLAAGGTHEPANVQLACFRCNCSKNAGAANDQLRLIG